MDKSYPRGPRDGPLGHHGLAHACHPSTNKRRNFGTDAKENISLTQEPMNLCGRGEQNRTEIKGPRVRALKLSRGLKFRGWAHTPTTRRGGGRRRCVHALGWSSHELLSFRCVTLADAVRARRIVPQLCKKVKHKHEVHLRWCLVCACVYRRVVESMVVGGAVDDDEMMVMMVARSSLASNYVCQLSVALVFLCIRFRSEQCMWVGLW